MTPSIAPLVLFFALLVSGVAEADDGGGPPPAAFTTKLAPATIAFQQLADRARDAVGTSTPSAFSIERERVHADNLDGTATIARAGDDVREDDAFGPLHTASGKLGTVRWKQDTNGITRAIAGVHDASHSDTNPTLLGLNTTLHAYVVRTGPASNPHFAFYDETTYLLTRTERYESGEWIETTYDDFAPIDGRMRARHVRRTNGDPSNLDERWFESIATRDVVDRSALAIPASRPGVAIPGGRVRLPAKIVSDRIVIETQFNKRKVNFQLDTGASTALLDNAVADAAGLQQFGRSTRTVAGLFVARQVLIPALAVGPLQFDRFFVESGPADISASAATPVAGLLGGDFLTSCDFAIDYAGGTVDALDPTTFTMPSDAIVLPARFDDGVPAIDVRIGNAQSHAFILDTGADRSILFDRFVKAHPSDTADRGLGSVDMAANPFGQYVAGVGGLMNVRTREAGDFHLGSLAFARWPFLAITQSGLPFENDDYDGLIGQDVLRYFTVYLDYAHERIGLVPNARYTARFGDSS